MNRLRKDESKGADDCAEESEMAATAQSADIPSSEHEGLSGRRRWYAVFALTLGTIVTTISGSMVNVALPVLAREFHVAPAATVLVVTVYQLVLMMTLLPFSALGDRFGH